MITALPKTFEEGIRSIHDEPQMALGEYYHSNDLNIHTTYVRFSEAVKLGDAVRTKRTLFFKNNMSPQVSGGSAYAAAGSMQITEYDATYLTSLAGVPPQPDYRDFAEIAIPSGAGAGQHGVIQDYNNKTLNILWYSDASDTKGAYTTGQLTTALDGTTDYQIIAPWYVEKAEAFPGQGMVNGIALTNAKKDQYGLIIWCGLGFVKVADAVSEGDALVSTQTASDEGGGIDPGAATIYPPYATALHSGAADSLVRSVIHCTPISIVPELPRQQVRGFERPRKSIAA